MSGRDVVLRRVREALGRAPGEAAGPEGAPPPPAPEGYRRAGDLPRARLVELFVERVGEYGVTVRRVAEGDLPRAIAEELAARGARSVAAPADLPPAWRTPAVAWSLDAPAPADAGAADAPGASGGPLPVAELDACDGVVTACSWAVAETGTIVFDGGERQGRRLLTLLPDLHLCVVREDQVVQTVPEVVARTADAVRRGAPLTLVSGPSATSDIELDRVEGVHGPRTLVVLLVR